jgi:catechol 2,3-dioxygenase-like lactoylglutathione lyase family enzyme
MLLALVVLRAGTFFDIFSYEEELEDQRSVKIVGIDHIQLAMPPGDEAKARAFYVDLLGLVEVPKPPHLARRGGAWFELGPVKVHLGVERDFKPARKAHPGLLVDGLSDLIVALEHAGYAITKDDTLEGYNRVYVDDPFGNRIELLEPADI